MNDFHDIISFAARILLAGLAWSGYYIFPLSSFGSAKVQRPVDDEFLAEWGGQTKGWTVGLSYTGLMKGDDISNPPTNDGAHIINEMLAA